MTQRFIKNKNHRFSPKFLSLTIASIFSLSTFAQEANTNNDEEKEVEKIQVVGSHIKGGPVAEALAVSVIGAEEIGSMGIDSIDDLLQLIPENGQNFFNEAENINGGVNAARGDVGTYNLRNLGTGNTLVLLNGRRLVNAAAYQTEAVGGSNVPVSSVNVNTIPVAGLSRVEVLRDGASAIYGADAVAGVVNHVLKSNFVGFTLSGRWAEYEHLPRDEQTLTLEWGKDFNEGRTNVSTFINYYSRDRVSANDDPRWADSDLRSRVPEDSPWFGDIAFRNSSADSLFGQYDLVSSASGAGVRDIFTDSNGEFETYPIGDERCEYNINATTCGAIDGQGTYRYNSNSDRDISSELSRMNFFMFVNHEFENGIESFTELSYYQSKTNLRRHATTALGGFELIVGAENYYNPFGPCGSPNRLPDELIPDVPCDGLDLRMDFYRFAELPRIVDNDGDTYRFLQGFRGEIGEWYWETAFSRSKATKEDITHNRVSNTLMVEALEDPTAAAYNPFSGGVDSNLERALISVVRNNETELTTLDAKLSHPEIFTLPAGPVGFVVGIEYREESFIDDRDDRLDGTIPFTYYDGTTYPYTSDVLNSSPTPDSRGEREVSSLFAELQVPILENLNAQMALRYEDFSDVGNTTVGKVAFGWRPLDMLLVRGSWSEAYRVPNLVTVNEDIVARNNSRTDYACAYAAAYGGDPDQDILDCTKSIQRIAQGSDFLKPEESTNTSIGFVLTPTDDFTLTFDYWSIKKESTIGLFGEENHTVLDLLLRIENGLNNCGTAQFDPAVTRNPATAEQTTIYEAAGICAGGDIERIVDQYANLDDRNLAGYDLGIYYDLKTKIGKFKFSYNGSLIEEFEQVAGGQAGLIVAAQESGVIPASIPIDGFADLIGRDGNQEKRQSMRVSWRKGDLAASLSGNKIGSFYQSSLTLEDGTRYIVPSMTTFNATFDYSFDVNDISTRLRLGVRNLTDERAPLADRYFGFFSDAHRDYGRSYYMDFKTKF
jgi:outer membrane receptor protein involved in Fe transport